MVGVDFVHPFRMENGFARGDFSRKFRTPNRITRRVPVAWVLPLPTYFNCCPFFPNTLNCNPLSGDQLIFISRKSNFSFAMVLTLSYFSERGRSVSFFHVSAVNFKFWLPVALSTVF